MKGSGEQKDYRLIWISNLWSIRNVGIIILLAQPLYKVPLLFLIPLSSPLCHSQPSPPQSFFSLSCSLLFHLSRSFPSLFSLSPHLPPLSFYLLSVTYPPPNPHLSSSFHPSLTQQPPFHPAFYCSSPFSHFILPPATPALLCCASPFTFKCMSCGTLMFKGSWQELYNSPAFYLCLSL